MDIRPAYSFLLERPWIHTAKDVTSTLHLKLKLVVDSKIVVICGKEDILVSHLSFFRYVEVEGDTMETLFQALELDNTVIDHSTNK